MAASMTRTTRSGRAYASICASLGAQPVICSGVDIQELVIRAIEREGDTALAVNSDDESGDDLSDDESGDDFAHVGYTPAWPTEPEPVCACSSAGNPTDQASHRHAVQPTPQRGRTPPLHASGALSPAPCCGQKRERSCSPEPPQRPSKNARKHKKKKYARAEQRAREGHIPRPNVVKRNIEAGSSIKTTLDSETLPAAHGAYVAKNSRESGAKKTYHPEDLDRLGLKEIPWDGLSTLLVLDAKDRAIVVCVGPPDAGEWPGVQQRAFDKMNAEAAQARFTRDERKHRRGRFPAINTGISMGTGPSHPGSLDLGQHTKMVERLIADPDIIRMANHASASFNSYAPKIAQYYRTNLDELFRKHKDLKKPFPRSTYPTAAFNLGPKVCTFKHRDHLNCPFGLCAIQALGRFDHTKGGHIILWDLGIYIQFPPGSLILIPSATLVHSNTPVRQDESRASFTQYCGGGLIHYVENGFTTDAALKATNPAKYAERQDAKASRWAFGLSCFSVLDELVPKENSE